jgi:hypothetical protein
VFLLSACVSVKDEIFLRNIQIDGSPSQPPVHVTEANMKEKSVYASPYVSFGTGTITSSLERQYKEPIGDTLPDFKPEGLSWSVPRVAFGLNVDYAVTDGFAVHGGIGASVGKGRQYTSLYGGIGLYSAKPTTSVRFDVGIQYIDIQFKGATVIFRTVGSGPQDTLYFLDQGKEFQFNLFANLTINSSVEDRAVNWFFQLGINPQTLTTFVPRESASGGPGGYLVSDQRAESSVFWFSATPGFFFTLADNQRLVLGVRFLRELQGESSKPEVLIMPMLQFDWAL